MEYFIKLIGHLTARNKLQEAVGHVLKDNDCLLVEDVKAFLEDIKGDIGKQVAPEASPESNKVM